jgi:hypothetical protein
MQDASAVEKHAPSPQDSQDGMALFSPTADVAFPLHDGAGFGPQSGEHGVQLVVDACCVFRENHRASVTTANAFAAAAKGAVKGGLFQVEDDKSHSALK